jgi:hypothetical protein
MPAESVLNRNLIKRLRGRGKEKRQRTLPTLPPPMMFKVRIVMLARDPAPAKTGLNSRQSVASSCWPPTKHQNEVGKRQTDLCSAASREKRDEERVLVSAAGPKAGRGKGQASKQRKREGHQELNLETATCKCDGRSNTPKNAAKGKALFLNVHH